MTEYKIIEILMKEAHTELSQEERRLLDQFRAESADNAAFVEENIQILNNMPTYDNMDLEFVVEEALTKVNNKKETPSKVVSLPRATSAVEKKTKYFAWLAAAVVVFGLSTFIYNFLGHSSDTMVYSTDSDMESFLLSDGSEVLLNKNSTLTLSNEFGDQLREMQLEGEAYFKVKNMDDQPFIVNAGLVKVEVVGTQFNVNNRQSNKAIAVFVNEGKVKVSSSKSRTKVLLSANESCQFDKQTNTLVKAEAGQSNATSWFSKNLSFNNVPLGSAIEDIEAHFDIDVSVDKVSCLDSLYTSLFNDPNADEVLKTISSVFDFQIIQKGDKSYQLAGGKCE